MFFILLMSGFIELFCKKTSVKHTKMSCNDYTLDFNVSNDLCESNMYDKQKKLNSKKKTKKVYVLPENGIKIGFLKIPSIKPMKKVIKSGTNKIRKHMEKLFVSVKESIISIINDVFFDIKPEIEKIIVAGNQKLYKEITLSFCVACDKFTEYMYKLSNHEEIDLQRNICKMKQCMYKKIKCEIKKMNKQIASAIELCNSKNVDNVIAALTEANDNVIVQIKNLLDDPNNTVAIIPQLLLADPVAISNLLDCTNASVLKAICTILITSLKKIKHIMRMCENIAIRNQEDTFTTSNEDIIRALTKELYIAMVKIKNCIQKITKKQIKQIETLEKQIPPSIPKKIQELITKMKKDIIKIINRNTQEELKETNIQINKKNEYIINTVRRVLG